ncbi:SwmB domain-containing protein, partial [Methylobacterium sp. WL9]|uniref:SwmB domain-containing protein n=1 Tax=Methylobacterium sp. WL9 TaxID=2603898 RepID=UPI0011DB38EB
GALDAIEFLTGDGDLIDLSAIDANTNAPGTQGFSFIGTGAFTGQAGQLRYQKGTGAQNGTLVISADLNGDSLADFQFLAGGSSILSASNFILGGGGGGSDTTPPTLSITTNDAQLTAGETATLTFSFSEPVAGFSQNDITPINGQLSAFTSVNTSIYTAVFTPTSNVTGQGSVAVAAGSYTDVAGNTGGAGTLSFSVNTVTAPSDTTPPVYQSANVNGATLVLTYNEALDSANPPAPGAFAVRVGGNLVAVSSASVNSAAHTVSLTLASAVTASQSVTVAYTDPTAGNDILAIQDLAGNDAASLGAMSVPNTTPPAGDTTPPVYQTASVNGTSLVLTYGEALDASNTPLPSAFAVTAGGNAVGVSGVIVNSANRTVTLTLASAVPAGQAVSLTYTDPSVGNDPRAIQDLAGNDAASVTITNINNTTPGTTTPLTINGTEADNVIVGGAGNDTLRGNGGNDTINGAAGNDYVSGGAGNDLLTGGPGTDTIYGGAGADRYVFQSVADFGPAGALDAIEFLTGDGDLIDLSAIDANTNAPGTQGFSFIGTGAFTGQAGQLRYQKGTGAQGGSLIVGADLNGDSVADFQLQAGGSPSLTASNFILGG